MKEKNGKIVQEPSLVKTEQNDELKNLERSNNKKNAIIIVLVFVILLMLALVLLYYFNNKDKNQGGSGSSSTSTSKPAPTNTANPSDVVLSSDEAIKIAKEKIEMANNFSNDDKCFKENREREDGTNWCYYGTIEDFKNKFYAIYSSKLVYKDVMNEYKSLTSTTDWSTNVKIEGGMLSSIPNYVIDGNKIYRDSCTIGSGTYSSVAKFTVVSITNDTLKIDYVIMEKEPDIENAKEQEREKATIILVKEDNDWKILKATIVDMCNGVYTVGKES